MFCKYCGKEIDKDAIFCSSCGRNQTITNSDSEHTKTSSNSEQTKSTAPKESQNAETQIRPKLSVGFFQAIKNFYLNYANFNGRTVRSEFWWSVLYEVLYYFVIEYVIFKELNLIETLIFGDQLIIFYYIAILVNMLPSISLCIRRLHDIGKSGWCYLWNVIPIVGEIILTIYFLKDSSFSDNQWGLSPYNTTHEYDETKTWRCEKCGSRTSNAYLTCKICGEIKPSSKPHTQPTAPQEKSNRCACGEIFYGQICPNCGRTKNDGLR